MNILDLKDIFKLKTLLPKDENGREINIYKINDCVFNGKNNFYPNNLIYSVSEKKLYKPINEKIMSLVKVDYEKNFNLELNNNLTEYDKPLFYFIYNTDNYYHFVYDTLPYLISYFEIKKEKKDLKLLMNYPNKTKKDFYPFVSEFLSLLGIEKTDIIIIDNNIKYKEIYISSSYTHGDNSDSPPRKEIFDFYNKIKNTVPVNNKLPKKIYISRRSWIHNDFSNIGTNYTTRRKMTNEDDLVSLLNDEGFVEVFTEKLSTIEKLQLFKGAEIVVGSIGGGLCNVLFSDKNCKLYTIVSPTFLDVNKRFIYSLDIVKNHLFYDTYHTDESNFKTFMRIMSDKIVGEIVNVDGDILEVIFDDEPVAGWGNDGNFKKTKLHKSECVPLDNGLNSEYTLNLINFKKFIK